MEQKQKEVARLGDLICKEIPDKPGIKLEECMDLIKQKYHDDMSEQILQMASKSRRIRIWIWYTCRRDHNKRRDSY